MATTRLMPSKAPDYVRTAIDRSQGRSVVMSIGGIAASEHPLASQAGATILAKGGSAVDAAIAVNAVMGVVAPMILGHGVSMWYLAGHAWYVHAFVRATLAATSVGITARVLKDMRKMDTKEARIILGAAVVDDVLGLIILAVVSGLITSIAAGGFYLAQGITGLDSADSLTIHRAADGASVVGHTWYEDGVASYSRCEVFGDVSYIETPSATWGAASGVAPGATSSVPPSVASGTATSASGTLPCCSSARAMAASTRTGRVRISAEYDLPCGSSDSERVTPPPSDFSSTRLIASTFGIS